jgi:hypothetical protein
VLALALAAFVGGIYIQVFRAQAGIDFYHFWGVAAARRLASEDLGTPYANDAGYAAILNQRADASTDPHFKRANRERRTIDPTGTPLLYMLFAPLPDDYHSAHVLHRIAQIAALVAAVAWLCAMLGGELATSLGFAFAVPIFYQPFQIEMAVGNINSMQLLACVAFASLARRLAGGQDRGAGGLLACSLAAFVLFKPNLLLVALLLAAFLWRALGGRRFVRLAGLAALAGAALVALSSAWFGTWRAWPEWLAFVRGAHDAKLASYPVDDGNYAAVVLLRGASAATRSYLLTLGLVLALVATWLAAAFLGRGGRSLRERLAECLADPLLLISTALLVGLAVSPLVWFHYALLALFPCLWLALAEPRPGTRSILAFTSLGLYAQTPGFEVFGFSSSGSLPWLIAFAWVPAWCALVWRLARPPSAA